MATLILQAGTSAPISVTCQRAGKASPRFVGSKSLSFSGRERTSIRGQAKVIPIVASYVSTADEAAIQAAVMNGVQIPCSGDILGNLQTLCSIDSVVSNMIPGLVDFWEMSFTVNEVNASTILARYAPGDTVTGEAFTRSTANFQINSSGVLASAAINVKRDGHWLTTNTVRTLLLEEARTNNWTFAEDLSNAVWTKTRSTITTNATTAPDGAATADKLVEDSSATTDHYFERNLVTPSNSTLQTWSFFAKAAERSWLYLRSLNKAGVFANTYVNLSTGALGTSSGGSQTIRVTALNAGWFRFEVTFNASTGGSTPKFEMALATGDNGNTYTGNGTSGAYVWGLDNEVDAGVASSYMPTTSSRGAETYSIPFTTPPCESTFYLKFYEKGTILISSGIVAAIDAAADASPRLLILSSGSLYGALHSTTLGSVTSTLAVAPAMNDVVELCVRLFSDGSVDITQSINGGAATTATQSAALAFASAWSAQTLFINGTSSGTARGFIALQSLKVAAGARSLAEMRAA